jgi:hypothetical protein
MKFSKFIIVFLLSLNFTSSLAFEDVADDYKFFEAIDYLKSNEIINGYDDGTFKPLNNLNRAEALKIMMLSSDFSLKGESDCFDDVPSNVWYEDYVCSAKSYGFIKGYEGNLFKPDQEISRAEALKISMELMKLEASSVFENVYFDVKSDDWFYDYVVSANNLNLLPFTRSFLPNKSITRGELSEVFYRTLTLDIAGASVDSEPENDIEVLPEDVVEPEVSNEPEPNEPQNVVTEEVTQDDFNFDLFTGVTLSSSFDDSFYKNTFKNIKGEAENAEFVFVGFQIDNSALKVEKFPVVNGSFDVNILVPDSNSLKLAIYLEGAKQTKLFEIDADEPTAELDAIDDLNLSFGFDGKPYLNVSGLDSAMKLEFTDGSKTKSFYINESSRFYVPKMFFEGFKEGELTYKVYGTELLKTDSVQITNNYYSEVAVATMVNSLPLTYEAGDNFQITGQTQAQLNDDLYLIKPDGLVLKLTDEVNVNGNSFSFELDLTDSGVYFVELNNVSGIAEINHPIYLEGLWPVVPDFRDTMEMNQLSSLDVNAVINQALGLINESRLKYGLDEVVIDNSLNQLAQYHADNMVNQNFVAHVDHLGEGPNERRLRFDIKSFVGENLTYNNFGGVLAAHDLLMRSAIHRANILNPNWNSVGIGARLNADNALHFVQEFSYDIDKVFETFDKNIKMVYDQINTNQELLDVLNAWTQIMQETNRYELSIDGQEVTDLIPEDLGFQNYRLQMTLNVYPETLLDSIDSFNLNGTVVYKNVQSDDGKLYTLIITAT